MESLIAYIAQKYEIRRENLATVILVQILRSGGDSVIRALFKRCGLDLPFTSDYQLHPQRRCNESRGIPDIQIKDGNGNTLAIIENKFDADFSHHQPKSYLNDLQERGPLLFIVPERRQRAAFEKLMALCRNSDAEPYTSVIESGGTRASVNERDLVVTSWQSALDILKESLETLSSGLTAHSSCSDLEQLRRFCEVADKETFPPLTSDQIGSSEVPNLIRHLTWIVQKLLFKCMEANILQEIKLSKVRADFDSSLSFGQNVSISGEPIWIGFWALAWELAWEKESSPICIELDPKRPQASRIARQLQAERGEHFVIKRNLSDHESWLIPVPIKPCVPQDEVVQEAFRFVSDLKASIDEATNR